MSAARQLIESESSRRAFQAIHKRFKSANELNAFRVRVGVEWNDQWHYYLIKPTFEPGARVSADGWSAALRLEAPTPHGLARDRWDHVLEVVSYNLNEGGDAHDVPEVQNWADDFYGGVVYGHRITGISWQTVGLRLDDAFDIINFGLYGPTLNEPER
jgi:hypothetical protein